MSEVEPEIRYQTELPIETQAAVGRLIMCWAALEIAVSHHVAWLIAVDTVTDTFNHTSFARAAPVCSGTALKAALAQLVNLTDSNEEISTRLNTLGNKLLKIKEKRDAVAHMLATAEGPHLRLKFFGASRSRLWNTFVYTEAQLDGWTHKLAKHAREIESLVQHFTRWDAKRHREDQARWIRVHGGSDG